MDTKQEPVPADPGKITIGQDMVSRHIIQFNGLSTNTCVGVLDWSQNKLSFRGDIDEAARMFLQHMADLSGKPLEILPMIQAKVGREDKVATLEGAEPDPVDLGGGVSLHLFCHGGNSGISIVAEDKYRIHLLPRAVDLLKRNIARWVSKMEASGQVDREDPGPESAGCPGKSLDRDAPYPVRKMDTMRLGDLRVTDDDILGCTIDAGGGNSIYLNAKGEVSMYQWLRAKYGFGETPAIARLAGPVGEIGQAGPVDTGLSDDCHPQIRNTGYAPVPCPESITLDNGAKATPVLTLEDPYGGVAHIWIDDGCYVCGLQREVQIAEDTATMTPVVPIRHIFPELFAALKTLPDPSQS